MDTKDQDGWHSYAAVVVISWQIRGFVGREVHSWNKLEKLRRCISRVHFAKIHFGKMHLNRHGPRGTATWDLSC